MLKLKNLVYHLKEYANLRMELAELKFSYKSSLIASSLLTSVILLMILFLFILVLTAGASLLIGYYLGQFYLGFLVMACFYLIIGMILYFKRNDWIKRPFINLIIKEISSEN